MQLFSTPYRKRYLFRNLDYFVRQLRWGYQRFIRGWSDDMVWDMNDSLEAMVPEMLRSMAKHANGYPDGYTYESWVKTLNKLAHCFEELNRKKREVWTTDNHKSIEKCRHCAWTKLRDIMPCLWD